MADGTKGGEKHTMAINSKAKGKRYELEVASRFRAEGYDARRTAQYCGKTGDASDVVGPPGIHIEAKHSEKMELYKWMAQAIRDADAAGSGELPLVIHRKNHADTLVTMRFEDWIQLYREWEAGR